MYTSYFSKAKVKIMSNIILINFYLAREGKKANVHFISSHWPSEYLVIKIISYNNLLFLLEKILFGQ